MSFVEKSKASFYFIFSLADRSRCVLWQGPSKSLSQMICMAASCQQGHWNCLWFEPGAVQCLVYPEPPLVELLPWHWVTDCGLGPHEACSNGNSDKVEVEEVK